MKAFTAVVLLTVSLSLAVPTAGSQENHGKQQPLYQLTHHDLEVELDLDRNHIAALDKITYERGEGEDADIYLLLRRGLTVETVRLGEDAIDYEIAIPADPYHFEAKVDSEDVSFYERAQSLQFSLPERVLNQESFILEVRYSGVIRDSLAGADFSREYVTEQVTGIIDTMGIYLGAAAIYYPASPGRVFTYSLAVTVPEAFQCVTEGALQEATLGGGRRTETWVCRHPVDSFHIVGGEYVVKSVDHNGVQISTYFFPEQADLADRYLQACQGYIDLYNDLIAPYPFEKFAVVDNFFATGYGMPSFTLLGSQVLRLPFIIYISLGHEVCHNWWGNSVYVEGETGNWCEGLTTYYADYLYKEQRSSDEARQYRMDLLRDYTSYTNEGNDFPLREFRERHNPAQRAVGYGKSAMFYHMLRAYVSDEVFWSSLKRFYNDNLWSHGSWDGIRRAFEEESGMQLGWLFDQWIDRSGAPELSFVEPDKHRNQGGWEISFTLQQSEEGEPYVLDVPITVKGESQSAQMQVGISEVSQPITLNTIFEPASFSVDPDFDLFRRLDRSEIPPTLSEVLGAQSLTIVLPTSGLTDISEAYKSVAEQMTAHGMEGVRILQDSDVSREDLNSGSWLFMGTLDQNKAIPGSWIENDRWAVSDGSYHLLGEDKTGADAAMLAVERHPSDPSISVGFFMGSSVSGISEAGRKLRHYGKYSYLVFHGGRNVAKGAWELTDSKMTYHF